MSSSPLCRFCGSPLFESSPEGFCHRCAARGLLESEPGLAADDGTNAEVEGGRIGSYWLMKKLGEGGFGIVYAAEQTEPVRRSVALKVIKLGMDTQQVIARFEAERQALAMMDHPNIARVLDAGTTDSGRPFFVMELVPGIPITDYCDSVNLSVRSRLELFLKVCQAIQHAHQKGIIHRDIKPSNILVMLHDGVPVPKVIDFGIAKAIEGRLTEHTVYSQIHQFIGTPAYMSPEQAELNRVDVDTRSDIYSLGVLLYEMLAGSTPFTAKELMAQGIDAMRKMIREQEPVRPSTRFGTLIGADSTTTASQRSVDGPRLTRELKGDLDWIVMKCLEKDRTRRYETANGLGADLRRHLAEQPVVARPPSARYKFQKFAQRHRLAMAVAALFALMVVVATVVSVAQARRAWIAEQEASNRAESESRERLRAEQALVVASAQRQLANEEGLTLEIRHVEDLFAGKDPSIALAYLAGLARRNPSNAVVAGRLFSALTQRRYCLQLTEPLRHLDEVSYAEFSPDGRWVVTASQDHTARVWDGQTGQPLSESPLRHAGPVNSARFSPDSRWVVTASDDHTAQVWNVQTGKPLGPHLQHSNTVSVAEFSPDGRWVVTGSEDETARIWDARTGPLQHRDKGGIRSARFSPDSAWVVTTSMTETIQIWNAQTGQPVLYPLSANIHPVYAEFSPEGRRLITGGGIFGPGGWGRALVWDVATREALVPELFHFGGAVNSIRFSPDGQWVITASADHTARVWNATTGQSTSGPLQHAAEVLTAEFSPDGRRVVTASQDHTARIWDAATGEPLTEPLRHGAKVNTARFSLDGRRLVTASSDGSARIWETQPGLGLEEILGAPGVGEAIRSAWFSPDGNSAVAVIKSGNLRIWDTRHLTSTLFIPRKAAFSAWSAQFSSDGRWLLTGSSRNTAHLLDTQTGQEMGAGFPHKDRVWSAEFSPDGRWVVTASQDQTAQVWETLTGKRVGQPLLHQGAVKSARFSPDGRWVVTASDDQTAQVWNVLTGERSGTPLRHARAVNAASFSPNGKYVVTASGDNTAQVWDVRTGQPWQGALRHRGSVGSAEFSPDGLWVVTASDDNTARVWDVATGRGLSEPIIHQARVNTALFDPTGLRVVTASDDHTARIWDARTGFPLSEPLIHKREVNTAQFSQDGQRLLTASSDSTARLWETPTLASPVPEWCFGFAEAVANERFTVAGVAQPVASGEMSALRLQLAGSFPEDVWTRCAKVLLQNPTDRCTAPHSTRKFSEKVAELVRRDDSSSVLNVEALREATALDPTNSQTWTLLALNQLAIRHPAYGASLQNTEVLRVRAIKALNNSVTQITLNPLADLQNHMPPYGAGLAEAAMSARQAARWDASNLAARQLLEVIEQLSEDSTSGWNPEAELRTWEAVVRIGIGVRGPLAQWSIGAVQILTDMQLAANRGAASAAMMAWLGPATPYESATAKWAMEAEIEDSSFHPPVVEILWPTIASLLRPRSNEMAGALGWMYYKYRPIERLGKEDTTGRDWHPVQGGMVAYRFGDYHNANMIFTNVGAESGHSPAVYGVARVYRAMASARQGQMELARSLLEENDRLLPPMAPDQPKPVLDGKLSDYAVLTWWLATQEAKALIFPKTPE